QSHQCYLRRSEHWSSTSLRAYQKAIDGAGHLQQEWNFYLGQTSLALLGRVQVVIEVRPSCIVIHDYDLGDRPGEGTEPRLEKTLSVWDKGRFRYGFSAYLPQRGSLIIP